MKKLILAATAALVLLTSTGCGGRYRSPFSVMDLAQIAPPLSGEVKTAWREEGNALIFGVDEVFPGTVPTVVRREVRVYGEDQKNTLRGELAPGRFIDARGGWQAADGSPSYFNAQEINFRRTVPKGYQAALAANDARLAEKPVPAKLLPPETFPEPGEVEVVDLSPPDPVKPSPTQSIPLKCVQFRDFMEGALNETPPNFKKARDLTRECFP